MIYLGIVEDEAFMLQSIKETFSGIPGVEVTLEAQSMEDCLEELTPDVKLNTLLLDINLPNMSGLKGIRYLKEKRLDMDIIMLTNKDSSDDIFKALCAGAVSYISKKRPALLSCGMLLLPFPEGVIYVAGYCPQSDRALCATGQRHQQHRTHTTATPDC
ncbi:MAG: response regulator transcription factor [Saprospiraceae bacterium]